MQDPDQADLDELPAVLQKASSIRDSYLESAAMATKLTKAKGGKRKKACQGQFSLDVQNSFENLTMVDHLSIPSKSHDFFLFMQIFITPRLEFPSGSRPKMLRMMMMVPQPETAVFLWAGSRGHDPPIFTLVAHMWHSMVMGQGSENIHNIYRNLYIYIYRFDVRLIEFFHLSYCRLGSTAVSLEWTLMS